MAAYQFTVSIIEKNSHRTMRFIPQNSLSIQRQWNNLKTGPAIQFLTKYSKKLLIKTAFQQTTG